jgi:endonuclease/exonuclease/phosphatase family metal-dependent hydrolase
LAGVIGALVGVLAGCTATATNADSAEPSAIALPSGVQTPARGGPVTATPSNAAEPSTIGLPSGVPTPVGGPVAPMRVLQLNLCNSGFAPCFTGRAIAEAAAVIHTEIPDLVTLNEICQDDLPSLQQALTEVIPDGGVVAAFQGAGDRSTGDVYRCRNGQPYGIGLISRWPSVPGSAAGGGIYPSQDTDDPEERAWLCLSVAASPAMTVCTTHLAYTKLEVAAAQCMYLFGTVIAEMRGQDPAVPVVLGGDLNLGSGDSASMSACLPAASAFVDDGGVQLVVATPEFVVSGSQRIDLLGTTDHPGLLVTLSPHGRR